MLFGIYPHISHRAYSNHPCVVLVYCFIQPYADTILMYRNLHTVHVYCPISSHTKKQWIIKWKYLFCQFEIQLNIHKSEKIWVSLNTSQGKQPLSSSILLSVHLFVRPSARRSVRPSRVCPSVLFLWGMFTDTSSKKIPLPSCHAWADIVFKLLFVFLSGILMSSSY